jgi:hypothetical protein
MSVYDKKHAAAPAVVLFWAISMRYYLIMFSELPAVDSTILDMHFEACC